MLIKTPANRLTLAIICSTTLHGGMAIAADPTAADLEIRPQWDGQKFTAVEVAINFRGEADGTTVVEFPDVVTRHDDAWRAFRDVQFTNARASSQDPSQRIELAHQPGASVQMTYRIVVDAEAASYSGGNDYRPAIHDKNFVLWSAMVMPNKIGPDDYSVQGLKIRLIEPAGDPDSFVYLTSPNSAEKRGDSAGMLILGGDWMVKDSGNGLRLAVQKDPANAALYALTDLDTAYSALREYWGSGGDYLAVISGPSQPYRIENSIGGAAVDHGHWLIKGTAVDPSQVSITLTHEVAHNWIPSRLGTIDQSQDNPNMWFSEGLTEWLSLRLRARQAGADAQSLLQEFSEKLATYDASPAKNQRESGGVEGFFKSDWQFQRLVYLRGQMFFTRLDALVRQHSKDTLDLDEVLQQVIALADANPDAAALDLLKRASHNLVPSLDLSAELQKFAMDGATIDLPEHTFPGCGPFGSTERTNFVRGFDRVRSVQEKTIVGVVKDGPAWKAGLRDGMKLASFMERGEIDQPIMVSVVENGAIKPYQWLPQDGTVTKVRQLSLPSDATSEDEDRCLKSIGGM